MGLNKYLITPIKKRFWTVWVAQDRVDKWMGNWTFFFILGFGRSGTAFMADLLNQAQGAHVFHEPVLEDIYAHLKAHYNPWAAASYLHGFRKKEIYLRMRDMPPSVYGEVNGHLRCHAEAIRDVFPKVTLIHLVRDGRDVVRSTMPRRMMTVRNPFSMRIHPTKSDPWSANWDQMDRFSRICWYWQEENSRLRQAIGETVQFERILSSYDYFHDKILKPCQIFIDKERWEIAINSPRNVTSSHQMPKWDDWTAEQQRIFREICGEEMERCGYKF